MQAIAIGAGPGAAINIATQTGAPKARGVEFESADGGESSTALPCGFHPERGRVDGTWWWK